MRWAGLLIAVALRGRVISQPGSIMTFDPQHGSICRADRSAGVSLRTPLFSDSR